MADILEAYDPLAEDPGSVEIVPIRLHPRQYDLYKILSDPDIKQVLAKVGRRWGKTYSFAFSVVDFGLNNPRSPHYAARGIDKTTNIAAVGPDYRRAKRVWDELHEEFPDAIERNREDELTCWLVGGAKVEVYSGEHIGSIRGGGYDLVGIDEAFALSKYAVDNDIRPATADRSGRVWYFTTPKGGRKNWFAQKYIETEKRIREGTVKHMAVFEGPSWENPFLDPAFLEEMRQDLDPLTFDEEFGAMILDNTNNFLDPSEIRYIPAKNVPGNTWNTLHCDFAFGKPDRLAIDKESQTRKDSNCLNVLRQDNLGCVYSQDGLYEKDISMEDCFEEILRFAREYEIRQVIVELVGEDWFSGAWKLFTRGMTALPRFSFVRPTRPANWKHNAIRRWSLLLQKGLFYHVEGNPLDQPLRDEMEEYSEIRSLKDKCHDDALVTNADIMLEGVYRGSIGYITRERRLPPHFTTPEELEAGYHRPRISRYSLV